MRRQAKRKDHTLSMRLRDADLSIIDRAARMQGRSRASFARDAAVRAAEDVLMESTPIRMSAEGFDAFMAAISDPPTPLPEMIELFRSAAPWETNGSEVRK